MHHFAIDCKGDFKNPPDFLNLNDDLFRKPTWISLTLMRDFSKTHQSSLTLKGGSTSHLGLLPSGKKRKPLLLVARNHFILWLADHQRSRQQQSCGLRYATAWTKKPIVARPNAKKPIAARPNAKKLIAARPEGAEALSPGQRHGYNGNGQGALNQRSPAHSGKVKGKSFKIHLTQLSQIGKFKKLKPYALQLNIQTIRLLS